MKTVASIIAASLALAPAAVAAQAHDQVVEARIIVKTGQPTDVRRSSHQSGERAAGQRERDRAQARAEQNRRQNRDQQTEKTSRTLKVGANGEIDLSNLSGDIIVTRGSGNTAQLEILETARGRTVEDARSALSIVTVDIVERGSRVEVKAVYPRHDTRSRERQNLNVSVQYTLTAPENTRISAQTLSGDIRTTDIKGDLNLVSLSGDVTVTGGARVMSAKSTSGDVQIVNLRSEIALEANAVSGDVVIRDSRVPRMEAGSISGDIVITNVVAERVEAQTLNGDIEFSSPLEKNGRYELNSHSGDIRITPTGDTGFELDADSFSGNIQSNLKLKDVQQGSADYGRRSGRMRSLRGVYGDGSATLDITTFSGTVVIGK